jgi:hypothetical protein
MDIYLFKDWFDGISFFFFGELDLFDKEHIHTHIIWWFWGLNAGSQACQASTLPLESYLQFKHILIRNMFWNIQSHQ